MKRLLLIGLICLFCTAMRAELKYFQPGITWNVLLMGEYLPEDPLLFDEYVYIDKRIEIDGYDCMIMSWILNRHPEGEIVEENSIYLRTEGEKVYFKYFDYEDDNWYLMYDFCLKEGEGCYVYSPYYGRPNDPFRTYLRCVSITENNAEFDGWDTMLMEEYIYDDRPEINYTGIWIKGLGSRGGVIFNNGFGMDGIGTRLIDATFNGEIIYGEPLEEDMEYFQPGIEWNVLLISDLMPGAPRFDEYVYINERIEMDGYDCMIMSWIINRQPEGETVEKNSIYLRTEGEKVYFKYIDQEDDNWYLMYDFGLKEGEGCYIYSPYYGYSSHQPFKVYLRCASVTENNAEFDGWDTMLMEEYTDENMQYGPYYGTWLKGLGSDRGVLRNNGYSLIGGGSVLLDATFEGEVIYHREFAGIDEIYSDSIQGEGLWYDLQGRKITQPSKPGLYILDGKKIFVR